MSLPLLLESAVLVSQGAEAKVYKGILFDSGPPILLKYRFSKQYRHPHLDSSLTKQRITGEARALVRCLKFGVSVPGVRLVALEQGILGLEWVDGISVRSALGDGGSGSGPGGDLENQVVMGPTPSLNHFGLTQDILMNQIGREIAKMHKADIIHGDLTTSNMMLRQPSKNSAVSMLVLIDFGLSFNSGMAEDKAVDLYVLERAFTATHPDSPFLFSAVLEAYSQESNSSWKAIGQRLEEVRLRGRKRSMVG